MTEFNILLGLLINLPAINYTIGLGRLDYVITSGTAGAPVCAYPVDPPPPAPSGSVPIKWHRLLIIFYDYIDCLGLSNLAEDFSLLIELDDGLSADNRIAAHT